MIISSQLILTEKAKKRGGVTQGLVRSNPLDFQFLIYVKCVCMWYERCSGNNSTVVKIVPRGCLFFPFSVVLFFSFSSLFSFFQFLFFFCCFSLSYFSKKWMGI